MIKNLFVTIVVILFPLSKPALAGGTDMGHGGGAGEQNMVYSWIKLTDFLELCDVVAVCRTEVSEPEVITLLSESIKTTYTDQALKFYTAADKPELFPIGNDGLPIMVNAGSQIGDELAINLDRLLVKDGDIVVSHIDLSTAVTHLVQALAKVHGVTDEVSNELSRGLDKILNAEVKSVSLNNLDRGEFAVFAFGKSVDVGDGDYLEHHLVKPPLGCADASDFTITSLDDLVYSPYLPTKSLVHMFVKGTVAWHCADEHKNYTANLQVRFSAEVQTEDGNPAGAAGADWQEDKKLILKLRRDATSFSFQNVRVIVP